MGRGLNEDHPIPGYIPASLHDAIFRAKVRNIDKVPQSCTSSGSIQDLKRSKRNIVRIN